MKPPELNPETEESLPSRRSPEGPDPPLLTEVSLPSDSPLDLESVDKKMNSGHYRSMVCDLKHFSSLIHFNICGITFSSSDQICSSLLICAPKS